MSGSHWNRSGRRSGGPRPVKILASSACVGCESDAATAEDVVSTLIGKVIEIEAERGIKIDWMAKLPPGDAHSSRDVVNAIGLALTEAGIPNNLYREVAPRASGGGGGGEG